jgi:hypothetical protein
VPIAAAGAAHLLNTGKKQVRDGVPLVVPLLKIETLAGSSLLTTDGSNISEREFMSI